MGARIMMRSSGLQSSPCRMDWTICALDFGVDGVKRQRGFAGAGEAGNDREGVPGDFDVDILQVMLARAPDYQFGQAHETKSLPPQELRRPVVTLSPN